MAGRRGHVGRPSELSAGRRRAASWRWRSCGASGAAGGSPAAACRGRSGSPACSSSRSLIDPLFNKFEPLPRGPLRARGGRSWPTAPASTWGRCSAWTPAGAPPAPTPTSAGSAHTKRVVLYDNLIEDFPPDQVRSVVAHELGHVKHRDLPRGLLWLAIVAPAGRCGWCSCSPSGLAGPPGRDERAARRLPALALSLALVSFAVGWRATCCRARWRPRPTRSRSADRRARCLHRAGAPAGARATCPSPIRRRSRSCCSGPTRPRSSGSGRGSLGAEALTASVSVELPPPGPGDPGRRWLSSSGRSRMPSRVCHLEKLSSIASISSRMKRGDEVDARDHHPGHLALLDLVVQRGRRSARTRSRSG